MGVFSMIIIQINIIQTTQFFFSETVKFFKILLGNSKIFLIMEINNVCCIRNIAYFVFINDIPRFSEQNK